MLMSLRSAVAKISFGEVNKGKVRGLIGKGNVL